MRIIIIPVLIFSLASVFSSCSKKVNEEGRYIPKDAAFVFVIDGKSISSKLPWDSIKKNEWFSKHYSDTSLSTYMKSIMENPGNSGMDILGKMIGFFQKDSLGGYFALEGKVTDAAKFKEYSMNLHKELVESEKDGIHFLSNDKAIISWKDDRFIMIMDFPFFDSKRRMGYNSGNEEVRPVRDVKAVAANIFSLKEDNSLARDKRFSETVHKNGDIHFWVNIASLNSASAEMAMMSMLNVSRLYEESVMAGTVDFAEGKINLDLKTYGSKEVSKIWEKHSGGKINTDMIKRIPSQDIAVLLSLNFKPEGIRDIIKLAGLEGIANMGANFLGVTFDDFIKATKGDFLLAVANIIKDSSYNSNPDILLGVSVNDKPSFNKITAGLQKMIDKETRGGSPAFFSFSSNNELFAASNKESFSSNYINNPGKNDFKFLDKISGSPMGAYVDLQYVIKAFGSMLGGSNKRDSLDQEMWEATLNTWENLIANGGGYKNGGLEQHVELNMMDKSTNSLKQLSRWIDKMMALESKKNSRYSDHTISTDSIAIPDTTMMEKAPAPTY